ncbi:MAG: type I-U CRISPR-associated protein Csb2 [Candidatus Accumulibacter sp. UW26]|jgi:CRISPR-associated protein Csb2
MLQMELAFPLGRCFAAAHDDPRSPEWPPSPSRIFSALVASAHGQPGGMNEAVRAALQRFEALPAPVIFCPEADLSPSGERFVPVNDVKTFLDKKKVSHPSRPRHVGRHFPSAFLCGEPVLRYVWPQAVSDPELARLDSLAAGMTHVGTSHSMVVARFSHGQDADGPDWVPDEHFAERFLKVTQRGRLDELEQLHAQSQSVLRRPLPRCEHPHGYSPGGASTPEVWSASCRWLAWRLRGASWGIDTPEPLARSVRRALLSLLGDDAPAAAHGHDPASEHLAFLPLADVGHPHASGRVLGFAIAVPFLPAEDETRLMKALADLATVILPDRQVAHLERVLLSARLTRTLNPLTWCADHQGAILWSSVTPVILDRPPKRKTAEAVAEAVARSLENAGYPRPAEIGVLSDSDFRGAPRALEVPSTLPRYHARVRFAQPVRGPVIAGRGRHFGVGLFRPLPSEGQ